MASNGERRTVLVVDDEPHVVAYLEMLLQDQGYATVSAADGREGLKKTKARRPDLICLDITMPEESGVRMYRNLREDAELAGIPVVVVTAVTGLGADPEPLRAFLSSRRHLRPPDGFFSKPIDRQEFVEKTRTRRPTRVGCGSRFAVSVATMHGWDSTVRNRTPSRERRRSGEDRRP